MSHGHDVCDSSDPSWFETRYCGDTWKCFAMDEDDARAAFVAVFGVCNDVRPCGGVEDFEQFLIAEAAQATRRIVV